MVKQKNETIIPYFSEKIFIPILVAMIVAYLFSVWFPREQQKIINSYKLGMHGVWIFKTTTDSSTKDEYKKIDLFYLTFLEINNNLDVTGKSYKIAEKNQNGIITYDREDRSISQITGSLIKYDFLLNWDNTDKGLNSFSIFSGNIDKGIIKGTFINDVAYQKGTFCAKHITIEELNNIDFNSYKCE